MDDLTSQRFTLQSCNTCKEQHLTVLHDAVQQTQKSVLMVTAPTAKVYLDGPNRFPKVMLKVVKVLFHNQDRVLDTYAVLDDGSERSIILPHAVQCPNLTAQPETLTLRTVHQDMVQLHSASVTFYVSSVSNSRGSITCIRHSPPTTWDSQNIPIQ